ncbi:hypothetical protein QCA50_000931 [Cerrena zonata]|uniref:GPI inositol-deacylase n=1 Tax=Cerrena zonata TaxID=2478898 RepID=A0AAW0GU61_9APHY
MSWMSPSYVLQSGFNTSWTVLGKRYSLWLYREVGWEQGHNLHGQPVLFIPGNAGSSHQVRSIASSATRQYFSNPYRVSDEFASRNLKPLDFFAVEFNEDLSAFHGPTLDSEKDYTSASISYILSLYPPNTSIIVLGHSMGGIVATSLLPHPKISTIITMSTPHILPPARFDSRLDRIYSTNWDVLRNDSTPILSLCGGATDSMVPSESCILPEVEGVYRRTVFSSALEGSWTGVGHKEMVWCHQVRWRVARAALELGPVNSPRPRGQILDTWLRDGSTLPPALHTHQQTAADITLRPGQFVDLRESEKLELKSPNVKQTYLLPVPKGDASKSSSKFVLYLSQGSIPPTSPHHPLPLRATIRICQPSNEEIRCIALTPSKLKANS